MKFHYIALLSFSIIACKQEPKKQTTEKEPLPLVRQDDMHSFAKPNKAKVKHLDLHLEVDFEKKQISGLATWDIETKENTDEIIFDTNGLLIDSVKVDGSSVQFSLGHEKNTLADH